MNDAKSKPHPGWSLALDYGPLIAFFLTYKFAGVFTGTAVFMVAIAVAVAISKWQLGRVSPMLWLSAILVIGFGGLTIWFRDPKFIQIKPTIIYTLLSGLLFVGLAMGRPLLKYVLEVGYDGLTDRGWTILSRNWAFFFAAMAVINEVLRYLFNEPNGNLDIYITVKVWGLTLLSFIFALANIPVLTKHGFGETSPPVPPVPPVPPEG